jgi:hypothetical protein
MRRVLANKTCSSAWFLFALSSGYIQRGEELEETITDIKKPLEFSSGFF